MGTEAYRLRVVVPVADLRREPVAPVPSACRDELQETQLLFNECLDLREEHGDWCRVEAPEQPQFSQKTGWHGYVGWVRKRDLAEAKGGFRPNGVVTAAHTMAYSQPDWNAKTLFPVSFGTRLHIMGKKEAFLEIRLGETERAWVPGADLTPEDDGAVSGGNGVRNPMMFAPLLLGTPYLWGGRSLPLRDWQGCATGIDCSALVNLLFRATGLDVPRNAQDQWRCSTGVETRDLRAGDLIFISEENDHESINHVMMWCGGEQFIEASRTGDIVRVNDFPRKYGCTVQDIEDRGFVLNRRRLYFRRMATDKYR